MSMSEVHRLVNGRTLAQIVTATQKCNALGTNYGANLRSDGPGPTVNLTDVFVLVMGRIM